MIDTTCFFTGHRRLPQLQNPDLTAALRNAVNQCLEEGFRQFISGGALGFDLLAARQVIAAREQHPEISLTMALPAEGYDRKWSSGQRELLQQVLRV